MSDYTDMVERLRTWSNRDSCDAVDAIEALQKRIAALEAGVQEAQARIADLEAGVRAVLGCPTAHDERGHAYLKVPARSIYDLGAQLAALLKGGGA